MRKALEKGMTGEAEEGVEGQGKAQEVHEEEEQEPDQVCREGSDEEGSREGYAGGEGARDLQEGGPVPQPILQEVRQEIREENGQKGRWKQEGRGCGGQGDRHRPTSSGDSVKEEG